MAATLALVFRSGLRLLPLGLALAAAAMTFGALSLAGGSLTMASIAALPVLIGLAVDYAIQFQARFDEAAARASPGRGGGRGGGRPAADDRRRGLATATGFLVLLLSPVPMVRGFGLLLVLGIVLALGCALCAGFAALVRFGAPGRPRAPRRRWRISAHRARARAAADRARRRRAPGAPSAWRSRARGACSRSASRWRCSAGARHAERGGLRRARARAPGPSGAAGRERAPDETGVSGEIDVTVRAEDITDPKVIAWMTSFQNRVLREHGYKAGKRCTQKQNAPELCPALSLPDLFPTSARPPRCRWAPCSTRCRATSPRACDAPTARPPTSRSGSG